MPAYGGFGNLSIGEQIGMLPWPTSTPNLSDPAGAYQQGYQQAVAMNKALYGNIQKGYDVASRQLRRGQRSAMAQVAQVGQSERQDITDAYNAQLGEAAQNLISRGLGNTTVQQSVNRGIEADRSKANVRLTGELARLQGDYQDRFNQQRMALNQSRLNFMNSANFAYPDFGSYASLMQQQGGGSMLGQGGFGGASIRSGSVRSPFGESGWNAVRQYPMGSAYQPAASNINYSMLPTRQSVYGDPFQAASLVGNLGGAFMGGLGSAGALGALGSYGAYGSGAIRSAPVSDSMDDYSAYWNSDVGY